MLPINIISRAKPEQHAYLVIVNLLVTSLTRILVRSLVHITSETLVSNIPQTKNETKQLKLAIIILTKSYKILLPVSRRYSVTAKRTVNNAKYLTTCDTCSTSVICTLEKRSSVIIIILMKYLIRWEGVGKRWVGRAKTFLGGYVAKGHPI